MHKLVVVSIHPGCTANIFIIDWLFQLEENQVWNEEQGALQPSCAYIDQYLPPGTLKNSLQRTQCRDGHRNLEA
jgi:hypothetical protein